MVGFPTETPPDVKNSAQLLQELNPDRVHISNYTLFPGSDAFDEYEKAKRGKISRFTHHRICKTFFRARGYISLPCKSSSHRRID